MQQNKGIRVGSEGVRFSTKGKKTKIRAFDIYLNRLDVRQ